MHASETHKCESCVGGMHRLGARMCGGKCESCLVDANTQGCSGALPFSQRTESDRIRTKTNSCCSEVGASRQFFSYIRRKIAVRAGDAASIRNRQPEPAFQSRSHERESFNRAVIQSFVNKAFNVEERKEECEEKSQENWKERKESERGKERRGGKTAFDQFCTRKTSARRIGY